MHLTLVAMRKKPPPVDLNPPEVKVQQSRRGGARRLSEHEIDAAWAEIQARHRGGLGWKAPAQQAIDSGDESTTTPKLDCAGT